MAHFEPEVLTVSGEGIFPQISFDIPREMTSTTSEIFAPLREKAFTNLGIEKQVRTRLIYYLQITSKHLCGDGERGTQLFLLYSTVPQVIRFENIAMYRIVTALVWINSLKCPRTEEAFIGSRAQPEIQ